MGADEIISKTAIIVPLPVNMLRISPKSVVGIAAGYLAFRFFKKRNAETNEVISTEASQNHF